MKYRPRYLGGTLKFYRSEFTDYIVTIQNTGPFEVTLDTYLSTQPTRHLMNHRHFIVTKLGRGPNKKTYVKKRLRPPALFQNKWYFQQDIYNTRPHRNKPTTKMETINTIRRCN